uniref:Uncharacterized protein n=1 Tax=viral metagenome TaxID=1070528 RepID=A0A6C0CMP1_9ZZZZ
MKINARHASIVLIGLLILIILGSICYKCVIWENMVGSNINENLQEGNKKSYLNKKIEIKEEPFESYSNPNVPLREGELYFFGRNTFTPECCAFNSNVSNGRGCACITKEQIDFLSNRGKLN